MNTPNITLKVGDSVYFNYGCLHGSEVGIVTEVTTSTWGTQYHVELEDGSPSAFDRVVGEVSAMQAKWGTASGPIGAYLVSA